MKMDEIIANAKRIDNKGGIYMRMTIDGGYIFDLLDEGDFFAYEVEFEPGELTAHFYDDNGRTLFIIADQPLTEDNILTVGWEEYQIS